SRMTVYFSGGISRGLADSSALRAAISANSTAFTFATFGELAFCHPEESPASMVTEISDDVCACQLDTPRELKTPSTVSAVEQMPAVVSLCRCATETIVLTVSARCSGVMAEVPSKWRVGAATRALVPALRESGTGRRSGSGC